MASSSTVTTAAWKTKPSWSVIASNDRAVSPELQKAEAAAMKAASITVLDGFVFHRHDRRVEDEAILERDCEQRPCCFSRASEGRSGGDEGCFDHRSRWLRLPPSRPPRGRRSHLGA